MAKDKVTINTTFVIGGTSMPCSIELTRAEAEKALAEMNKVTFLPGDFVQMRTGQRSIGLVQASNNLRVVKVAFANCTTDCDEAEVEPATVNEVFQTAAAQKRRNS